MIGLGCTGNGQEGQQPGTTSAGTPGEKDCRAVFQANCATCHHPMKDAMGPALKGALPRWNNDTARLKNFIRNSGKMIADGDPRATELYDKWKANMTSFPNLTDAELDCLLEMMH